MTLHVRSSLVSLFQPFHPCGLLPPSTPGTCDKIIDSVLPSDVGSCDLVSGGVHDDGGDRSAGLGLTPRVTANCGSGANPRKSEYGQVHDDDLVYGGEKSIVPDLFQEDVFSFVSGACLSEATVASVYSDEVAPYPSVLTGAVIPVMEGPDIGLEALKPVTDGVNVDEFVLCSRPILWNQVF